MWLYTFSLVIFCLSLLLLCLKLAHIIVLLSIRKTFLWLRVVFSCVLFVSSVQQLWHHRASRCRAWSRLWSWRSVMLLSSCRVLLSILLMIFSQLVCLTCSLPCRYDVTSLDLLTFYILSLMLDTCAVLHIIIMIVVVVVAVITLLLLSLLLL